jgi:hypothetical protein
MKRKGLWIAAFAALTALAGYGASVKLRPSRAEYAWLVFGPTAKLRLLASVAGDTITLQRFVGEQPTGQKEQFKDRGQPLEVTLADPDGVNSYVITKCATPVLAATDKEATKELFVNVEVRGPLPYREYSDTTMAGDLDKAWVSHFHGPLTIGPVTLAWEIPSDLSLRRGETETDLRAIIGTMDVTRRCWVVVKTHEAADKCLFADGIRPVADIEFPSRNAGEPPIKRRYVLAQFC